MGLLRNVLAGLLVGAGKGMENIAEQDEQKRKEALLAARDELMWQREQALMAQKKADRMDEIVATADQTIRTNAAGEGERRISATHQGKIQGGLAEADDNRGLANAKALKAIDFKNDIAAKKVAGVIGLTLENFRAKVGAGEILQDSDGKYFVANPVTNTTTDLGRTGPVKAAEGGGNSLSDYRPGGGAPAAAPSSAKANPRLDSAMSRLQTTYGSATPETHPSFFDENGKKRPMSALVSQVRTSLGGL